VGETDAFHVSMMTNLSEKETVHQKNQQNQTCRNPH